MEKANSPVLLVGIASLVVGLLFAIFPKVFGVAFFRMRKKTLLRPENDWVVRIRQAMRRTLPAFSPDYDEAKAPKVFRFLGVVFVVQAVALFIISGII